MRPLSGVILYAGCRPVAAAQVVAGYVWYRLTADVRGSWPGDSWSAKAAKEGCVSNGGNVLVNSRRREEVHHKVAVCRQSCQWPEVANDHIVNLPVADGAILARRVLKVFRKKVIENTYLSGQILFV